MKERFIQNYVDKITKDDIALFARSKGIVLETKELDILYDTLKKEWKKMLYENPTPVFKDLKTKLNETTYEQGIELFYEMKQKYQSFL